MDVGIGEAGQNTAAAEVDDVRRCERRLVCPDAAGNAVAGDGERALDRDARIHRPDDPILQDHWRDSIDRR